MAPVAPIAEPVISAIASALVAATGFGGEGTAYTFEMLVLSAGKAGTTLARSREQRDSLRARDRIAATSQLNRREVLRACYDAPMIANLFAFAIAAGLEIAGCFAFWLWLRGGRSPLVALAGVVSLVGFAVMLTRVDAPFAGRAYAAYGGVYIAASLLWLWAVEGQRPTTMDLIGASVAVIGALIVIGFAGRTNS